MTGVRTYLDHNATSPLRPQARDAMIAALDRVGNPSSVHAEGRRARQTVETAREQVAALAGCRPAEVVFTSGATEAANTVLRGAWSEILYTDAEHAAVRGPLLACDAQLTMLPLSPQGVVDRQALASALAALRGGRRLLVLQAANNETGVVQPVAEIAALAHTHGVTVFTDAAQAAGKVDLVEAVGDADILTLSAHKIGGPTGVGALIRRGTAGVSPLLIGGGQERGNRAGTEAVAAIAGFGAAAMAARAELARFSALSALRDEIERDVCAHEPAAIIAGAQTARLPNTSAILLPGRRGETLVIAFDLADVAISAGAACSSGKVTKSLVLRAMDLDEERAASAIRVSLGWSSTRDDVAAFLTAWRQIIGERPSRKVA